MEAGTLPREREILILPPNDASPEVKATPPPALGSGECGLHQTQKFYR